MGLISNMWLILLYTVNLVTLKVHTKSEDLWKSMCSFQGVGIFYFLMPSLHLACNRIMAPIQCPCCLHMEAVRYPIQRLYGIVQFMGAVRLLWPLLNKQVDQKYIGNVMSLLIFRPKSMNFQ